MQAQTATKSELARMLGVSRQAVGDLVKRGILPESKDGKIDVQLAQIALADRVRPSGKTAQALSAATLPTLPAAADAKQPEEPSAEAQITSFHVARTLNEAAQARMNQIKLRQMQSELIEKEQTMRGAYQIARSVRDHLASRRRSISPSLANAAQVQDVEEILRADDAALLANLMREFGRLLSAPMSEAAL